MTIRTLDRSRPFGVVVGSHDGSAFMQDGVCFRGDDSCVDDSPAPAAVVAKAPEPAPAPAGVTRETLEALHPSAIKKLVKAGGLELETGKGSKAKNIENLLVAG